MASSNRQQYIPVSRTQVKSRLFQSGMVPDDILPGLEKVSNMMEAIWHHSMHSELEHLKSLYEDMDPDQIRTPDTGNSEPFLEILDETLQNGNWEEISQDELNEALAGEDVFPISLDVRFDELATLRLYKLGELTVPDVRTSWFGLKKQEVTIESFDRVIQILEFHEEKWFRDKKRMKHYPGENATGLHLRLFKTVPKLDLETIFPNTTPMMRYIDKIKIGAPLIGGLVTLGLKFGPVLFGAESGDTSMAVIGGLSTALGTYVLKSYLSYQKTRERYLAQVSKDLYFKGQANNAAVLNMIVDLAEEQEVKEALLAYTFLQTSNDKQYNQESLDDEIEDWLRENFGFDVDFEVDDALGKLEEMRLLLKESNGHLSVSSIDEALSILDDYWDNIYDY